MTVQMKGKPPSFPREILFPQTKINNVDLYSLPWQPKQKADKRFRHILYITLIFVISVGVIIPFISVPTPEIIIKKKKEKPLTKVIIEMKKEKVALKKKSPLPKPIKKKKPLKKVTKTPPPKKSNKAKAKNSGLLKMASQLSALKSAVELDTINTNNLSKTVTRKSNSNANALSARASQSDDRSVNTNISIAELDSSLAARDQLQLSGINDGIGASDQPSNSQQQNTSGSLSERSDSNIRVTMDKNKSIIYSIYNRALRQQADLSGKFIIRLVIDPNGKVSSANIVDSDLDNKLLENKLLTRIRLINFGAKDVAQTTIDYTLNFFPS